MDINKLQTFLTVAKYGSFKAAAEHLFLSPRAVSKQMNQVESEVGVQLFNRKNNRTELTQEGHEFIITAHDIVNTYSNALIRIRTDNQDQQNILRMGFSSSYQATILQDYLRKFILDEDNIKYEIQEESGKRLLSLIENKLLDIVVTPFYDLPKQDYSSTQVKKIDLFKGELYVGVSKSNPLAHNSTINLNNLSKLRGFYYSPFGSTNLRRVFLEKFKNFISPEQLQAVSTMEQRNTMVALNFGFGFYPSVIVDEEELKNPLIKFLPIENQCNKYYSSALWYNPSNDNPILKKMLTKKSYQ